MGAKKHIKIAIIGNRINCVASPRINSLGRLKMVFISDLVTPKPRLSVMKASVSLSRRFTESGLSIPYHPYAMYHKIDSGRNEYKTYDGLDSKKPTFRGYTCQCG